MGTWASRDSFVLKKLYLVCIPFSSRVFVFAGGHLSVVRG